MQLTQEAGAAGLLSVALFAAGLVFSVRTRKLSVAAAFIGSILAVGQIGQGLGQRAVLAALPGVDKADAVMILAAGSAEASANLLLSGGAALALLVVAVLAGRGRDA